MPSLAGVAGGRGRRWITHATRLYPEGWLDNGGPIRTIRTGIEKQHSPAQHLAAATTTWPCSLPRRLSL
ncbi:DUF6349 family protein [Streptomyces sp. 6N106]|uniref:DUF6349 family protein n=1 Tax=Streptomyces sp. 6N106 TaxID=3457418 RepID=UPI003FD24B0B